MNCKEFEHGLPDWLTRRMTADDRDELEAHRQACPPCDRFAQDVAELTCEGLTAFLDAYLEGRLPRPRRAVFDLHLAICPDCQNYLHSYRETVRLGALAMREEARPEKLPPDLLRAILATRDQPD